MTTSPFRITPTPPTSIQLRPGEIGKFSFTVTCLAAPDQLHDVIVQALRVGDDGKGKEVDWLAVSPQQVLGMAGGKTETVTVTVAPKPSTPRGEHRIRLVAADRVLANDVFTESPSVACEVIGAEAAPPRKRPWWLFAAIAVAVVAIAGGVVWKLAPSKPPAPANAGLGEPCDAARRCDQDLVCAPGVAKCLLVSGARCTPAKPDPCASGECDAGAQVCAIPLGGACRPGDGASVCAQHGTCDPGGKTCVPAAPATCDPPARLCGSACINVADSPTHCGQCGRSCGGGKCAGGKCQPIILADVYDELDTPLALAVTEGALYWVERTRVRSCPLPLGCSLEPRLIADTYQQLKGIAVTASSVVFSACTACDDHYELYRCPLEGCPQRATRVISNLAASYDMFSIAKSHLYVRETTEEVASCALPDCATATRWKRTLFGGEIQFVTSDGDTVYVKTTGDAAGGSQDLRTCPEATGCAAPAVLPSSAGITAPFRVHAGKAYYLAAGPNSEVVFQCDVRNCGRGTELALDSYGATEIEVDDTGVYWINPKAGTLRQCPLAGCPPGGPLTLASGHPGLHALTLGPGFVYWIEANLILKLAKP